MVKVNVENTRVSVMKSESYRSFWFFVIYCRFWSLFGQVNLLDRCLCLTTRNGFALTRERVIFRNTNWFGGRWTTAWRSAHHFFKSLSTNELFSLLRHADNLVRNTFSYQLFCELIRKIVTVPVQNVVVTPTELLTELS
jgi:hypothetical protein